MSFYHCQFKAISRQKVSNSVKYLAQKTGTNLTNRLTGETFKYEASSREVYLLYPQENDFPWIQEISSFLKRNKTAALQCLCEKLEGAEKRIDARLYQENQLGLHQSFTHEENQKLVFQYVQDCFVKIGMLVIVIFDFAKGDKGYCTLLLTTRRVTENGFARLKDPAWQKKPLLLSSRAYWAQLQNELFKHKGLEIRVDHRSYAAQGIPLLPLPTYGMAAKHIHARGKLSKRYERFVEAQHKNMEILEKEPELILRVLTLQGKPLTSSHVKEFLLKYSADESRIAHIIDKLSLALR